MTARTIELPEGRTAGLTGIGDPLSERLVVLCHPSPGAGGFDPDPVVSTTWGAHIIQLDRPGYGASPPLVSPRDGDFADRADDIASYVSRVERDAGSIAQTEFGAIGVIGWGTGGLVALALAARHARLVDRLCVIDTPAPRSFPRHAQAGPPYQPEAIGVTRSEGGVMDSGLSRRLGRMLDAAAIQDDAGLRIDEASYRRRGWIHDVGGIQAETLLVYGERHPLASPDRDGRWWNRRMPRSRLVGVEDGQGLTIATHWRRILAFLAPCHGEVTAQWRR